MLGVCGNRCYVEFSKRDIDAGMDVGENGVGSMVFKNKGSKDTTDYPVDLRFTNVESLDKFISALNDLKSKMEKN